MIDAKQKITQYLSKIVVRTMAKDLESMASGGGLISYSAKQEASSKPNPVLEFALPILPPDLFPVQQTPTPATPAASESLQLTPLVKQKGPVLSSIAPGENQQPSSKKADAGDKTLYLVLAGLGIVLLGSAGYWLVYPRLVARFNPQPTPSITPRASRIPPPPTTSESLNIQLRQSLPETVLNLFEKTVPGLREALADDLSFPAATSTLRIYNVTDAQGKQLTSQELTNLVVPEALTSFKSSLDEKYLLVSNYLKYDQAFVGIVFTLKPENLSLAQTLMQNWENANLEDYFTALYTPYSFIKRKAERFTNLTLGGITFRTIALNSDNPSLELIYGFQGNFLLIATHQSVIQALITNL